MTTQSRIVTWLGLLGVCGGLTLMPACEWTSGSGLDSWSDSDNWVNFSGTYRGANGGPLVSDFTVSPDNAVHEQIATGNNTSSVYSGGLAHSKVVVGSVIMTAGGFTFSDNGTGALTGNPSGSGTISYGSGGWTLNFGGTVPGNVAIFASYQFTQNNPGSSGSALYTFTVSQMGSALRVTDNNGATYDGNIGRLSTTGGGGATPTIAGPVVAGFSLEGTSAGGVKVTMTGTLQGDVTGVQLQNRIMVGTWVEDGGKVGDIRAVAEGTVAISTNSP